jgi:hypothetical protein
MEKEKEDSAQIAIAGHICLPANRNFLRNQEAGTEDTGRLLERA